MSDTVLFAVGAAVFALTVWGSVMAGGLWFARIQEEEADGPDRAPPGPAD
jgi:hypothetical protein